MKTKYSNPNRRARHGFLEVDLLVGLAILSLAIVPLGLSFARERLVLRQEYHRSVASEIIDGEMEILAAGDWKNHPDGAQTYVVHSRAAGTLPPGHFQLIKNGNHLRLEWDAAPNSPWGQNIGEVFREVTIK